MMDEFQSLRSAYQSKLQPDVLERIHAHDAAKVSDRARDGREMREMRDIRDLRDLRDIRDSRDTRDTRNLFYQEQEPQVNYRVSAGTDNQWWLKSAFVLAIVCLVGYLLWKGCVQVTFKELTIDDVPDDELDLAFEPEVAKAELQRRMAKRHRLMYQ